MSIKLYNFAHQHPSLLAGQRLQSKFCKSKAISSARLRNACMPHPSYLHFRKSKIATKSTENLLVQRLQLRRGSAFVALWRLRLRIEGQLSP